MNVRKSAISDVKPRERIIAAACELFGRLGVKGVGVDEIAAAADSNKMTLYRHFGSKEKLAVVCLQAVIEEIDGKWRAAETRGEPALALDDWIGTMAGGCAGADSRSELIFAVFRQARDDAAARPLLDSFIARHRKRLAGICRKAGAADGEALATALALLAYGVRADPWGLDKRGRGALFITCARFLTKLFTASPAKVAPLATRARREPQGKWEPAEAPGHVARPRDRILAAGCALFHKHGILAASVDEIAAAADSNKMTLYRHFGSKENLAVQCFKAALAEAEAILKEIEAKCPGSAPCQLDAFIRLIAGALAGADKRTEMIGMAMQAMRNETAGQAMMRDFELAERRWLARVCRGLGGVRHEVLSDALLLIMHGADANPWGLDRARLGTQYSATADAIVRLFRSQSGRDDKARDVADRGVVSTKHMTRGASRRSAADVHK